MLLNTHMTGLNRLYGLGNLKFRIQTELNFCKNTGHILGPTIITGLGGLGKSSLVSALAEELDYYLFTMEAHALKNGKIIAESIINAQKIATQHNRPLLYFIDEVHRLSITNQELLYYPLDKNNPTIISDHQYIKLNSFCLVVATTRPDMLDSNSFIARFDNRWHLERYQEEELCEIIAEWFKKHGYNISYSYFEIKEIARRSLGIPRNAIRLANRIRNYMIANGLRNLTTEICQSVFHLEEIDSIGLDKLHIKYLQCLSDGSPKGIDSLAGCVGQNKDVVLGTLEPILLEFGFIEMTPRGRKITQSGLEHIN